MLYKASGQVSHIRQFGTFLVERPDIRPASILGRVNMIWHLKAQVDLCRGRLFGSIYPAGRFGTLLRRVLTIGLAVKQPPLVARSGSRYFRDSAALSFPRPWRWDRPFGFREAQFAGFAPVRNDSKQREFVLEEAKRVTS